jgi:uncharacterized membrane protein
MTCGLYYFIIQPNKGVLDAFLLGIFVNGIYESTNYSAFSKWTLQMVVIDTIWGGLLFGITSFLFRQIYK